MPTIPLITQSQALPKLPDPVLDRERRPTVDYGGIMQGMGNMVAAGEMPLMRPDALSAPYEAMQSLGRGLADAGSVLGTYAVKKMEAESTVQVGRAEGMMQNTRAKFEEWKLKNPDASKWPAEWQRRVGELKTDLLEKTKLHNLAYNEILPQFNRYASASKAEVDASAAKATFAQAKQVYLDRLSRAEQRQDKPGHERDLGKSVKLGVLSPQEAEQRKVLFNETGVQQETEKEMKAAVDGRRLWEAAIRANPRAFKGMPLPKDPVERERALQGHSIAEDQIRTEVAELSDNVVDLIHSDRLLVPDQILKAQDKRWSPALQQHIADTVGKHNKLEEQKSRETRGIRNAAELDADIAEYEPLLDDEGKKYFDLAFRIGTRAHSSMAGGLMNKLQRKAGVMPTHTDSRTEAQKAVSRQIDIMLHPERSEARWLSRRGEVTSKGISLNSASLWDGKELAVSVRTAIDEEMEEFYRANPAKLSDYGAVMGHFNSVVSGPQRAKVLARIQKSQGK